MPHKKKTFDIGKEVKAIARERVVRYHRRITRAGKRVDPPGNRKPRPEVAPRHHAPPEK